jgi:glyoxylase-like metal-dependent hydrolase (beta-lactamase superfamily II)
MDATVKRALLAFSIACAACAPHFRPAVDRGPVLEPPRVEILRVELAYSNVHLLRGSGVVLVDAGSPSDVAAATAALAAEHLRPSDVKAVVLTHGHGDHAGTAAFFQKQGAKIILGLGDEPQAQKGQNDEMTPTSLFARVLKPFVRLDYQPFTPDVLVENELDLSSYGVPGVKARRMPGHTRGSLVVLVGGREAIVGDQMLGGIFGGAFHAGSAGEHYYQLDPKRNRCNVQALLDEGIERFHLGHGGPVSRDSVVAWSKSWPVNAACGPSD